MEYYPFFYLNLEIFYTSDILGFKKKKIYPTTNLEES
jgi:hypothetical protein